MDAQFQLGFELTNILNPASQVISTISTVAIAEAMRKAGSDAITEVKLASLLGKNRIDAILETHFRQAVAKSERTIISRYLQIFLESGAGPTVQNALKDTALFSMIVQMSLLCWVHEHQPLANAMVDAAERIARNFKGKPDNIPHFPSLLETMKVIQRETAAFRWSVIFDSVTRTIQDRLSAAEPQTRRPAKRRKRSKILPLDVERDSLKKHQISFPVLQGFLLALESLQHFFEERQMHIECATGISTLVVWCYHVLGLSVKVSIEDREVKFGNGPFTVLIKEVPTVQASISLIIPYAQGEPLFTLSSSEHDPKLGPELRAELQGFGQVVLREAGTSSHEMMHECYSQIAYAIRSGSDAHLCESPAVCWEISPLKTHGDSCYVDSKDFPGKTRILAAACMLFGLDEIDESIYGELQRTLPRAPTGATNYDLQRLLLSLSRIPATELRRCAYVPLCVRPRQKRSRIKRANDEVSRKCFDVVGSFDILASYLLGSRYSDTYVEEAVLVSECGWSLFFDVLDSIDPSDVSICNLRLVAGVPSIEDASKDRVTKERIVDGPREVDFPFEDAIVFDEKTHRNLSFSPGLSTAKREKTLIGFRDGDTFLASQLFRWNPNHGTSTKTHTLGFREMVEICNDFAWSSACACDEKIIELQTLRKGQIFTVNSIRPTKLSLADLKQHGGSSSEYAICLSRESWTFDQGLEAAWLFHVTEKPAARWLQMDHMMNEVTFWDDQTKKSLYIRDSETCTACALKFAYAFSDEHKRCLGIL